MKNKLNNGKGKVGILAQSHHLLHSHKQFVHKEANHCNYEKLRRIAGLAFGS